jgi:M6 family metalloprotease-like protein
MKRSTFPLALILAVLPLMPALAQYPRARFGQFEVRGMDFRPDGAWRKRTDAIRSMRRQLLRARLFGTLNAPQAALGTPTRVTGIYYVPVVPITFQHVVPSVAVPALQDALFNPAPTTRPYSVKTFYEQLSSGNITMDGVVFPWVTADSTDTYYEDDCNGVGVRNPCAHPGRFGQLLLEALAKNDDGIRDWGQYDNDGPDGIPNSGDDDGVVDFVTFLQPELDGACGTPHIWAHRYVISGWNGGSPYVTKSPRRDQLGNPIPGQFITVDDYTMQSAVGGSNACTDGVVMPIGTVAHETGHAFGLPDLYDTEWQTSGTEGIGEWGLMGSGNYARPYSPSRYEAWSLTEMGWVTVDTLTSSRTVLLSPVSNSDTVLYVPAAGNTHEFFLLENRQALASDSAQMNPAFMSHQKSPGLLVWHIDQNIVDAHGFRSGDNEINVGPVQGVALLQADGLNQLRTPFLGNRGDMGDSYPGSKLNRKLSAMTNPAAVDNAGAFAGFSIDSIYQVSPNGPMAFRFLVRPRSLITTNSDLATVQVDGVVYGRYDDIIAPGTQIAVATDSLQTANAGRSSLRFLSWSNQGARSQTFTAGAFPDTLIASFEVRHELQARAVGGGSLTATPSGDYATGVFLLPGSVVTLAPAPPPTGLVFTGWSGDTSTDVDTLVVTVTRPRNIIANFTTTVPVTLANAVNEILASQPGLDATQKTFLDQIGNRNGGYDLGDFLAYLDLTGVTVSPRLMGRLLAAPAAVSPRPGSDPSKGKVR